MTVVPVTVTGMEHEKHGTVVVIVSIETWDGGGDSANWFGNSDFDFGDWGSTGGDDSGTGDGDWNRTAETWDGGGDSANWFGNSDFDLGDWGSTGGDDSGTGDGDWDGA
ncbi:unnamed protein product [[Candida] boidinii]|nr:unnamed protein product [[Candida] boidinii]